VKIDIGDLFGEWFESTGPGGLQSAMTAGCFNIALSSPSRPLVFVEDLRAQQTETKRSDNEDFLSDRQISTLQRSGYSDSCPSDPDKTAFHECATGLKRFRRPKYRLGVRSSILCLRTESDRRVERKKIAPHGITEARFVFLTCGSGNDFMNGGPGNDLLVGGPGIDAVFGGGGIDLILP
jgi:hypothetical protein